MAVCNFGFVVKVQETTHEEQFVVVHIARVLMLCEYGIKMLIHANFWSVLGILTTKCKMLS